VGSQQESFINDCYSTGNVSGNLAVGGLVGGRYQSSSTSSYWDTGISGQSTSAGGEGRTTEQMTYPYDANTYVGWDFTNIWAVDADHTINDSYPYLRQMPVSIEEYTDSVSSVSLVPTIRNYPNPFNPQTTICFYLPQNTEKVDLMIYNLRGQLVRKLIWCLLILYAGDERKGTCCEDCRQDTGAKHPVYVRLYGQHYQTYGCAGRGNPYTSSLRYR